MPRTPVHLGDDSIVEIAECRLVRVAKNIFVPDCSIHVKRQVSIKDIPNSFRVVTDIDMSKYTLGPWNLVGSGRGVALGFAKLRAASVWDAFHEMITPRIQSRCFTGIGNMNQKICRLIGIETSVNSCYSDPCALVNLEVMAKVSPLNQRNGSIQDSGSYSEPLQPIFFQKNSLYPSSDSLSKWPPWRGTICGLLGLLGIFWGWRNGRWLPWSAIAFICGCVLSFYASIILLPWSVS